MKDAIYKVSAKNYFILILMLCSLQLSIRMLQSVFALLVIFIGFCLFVKRTEPQTTESLLDSAEVFVIKMYMPILISSLLFSLNNLLFHNRELSFFSLGMLTFCIFLFIKNITKDSKSNKRTLLDKDSREADK